MNFKLINVIRKDDNGQLSELSRVTMYVDLIITPKEGMSLGLEKGGQFLIHHIKQDLKEKKVLLYQFDDICHQEFWDEDFLDKYLKMLFNEGWMKLPKK